MWRFVEDVSIELNPVPGQHHDSTGTLIVGLGDPNLDSSKHTIVLNHKGYKTNSCLDSVSHFVAAVGAENWDEWGKRLPHLEEIKRIVVEDFSLDTCFALYLFLAMHDGSQRVKVREDMKGWLEYVSAWEGGHYVDGTYLRKSAACLHTVLAHSYVPNMADTVRDDFAKEGLKHCLKFLSDMIAHHSSPSEGIGPMNTLEYTRAVCHLDYEKQLYKYALEQGHRCQLLVDLEGSGRLVLTDVLILSEVEPSGILKILARTDQENSWSKKGFSLLAIHRPSEIGTGNDMTISVDPDTGMTLKSLWDSLERKENERWAGKRPKDSPRRLVSYPDEKGNLLEGAPNQPWYDENGKFTLIGAPKRIDSHTLGSKLKWQDDVLSCLWEQYLGQYLSEWIIDENRDFGHEKIRVMRWREYSNEGVLFNPNKSIIETPTFHAWLASHVLHQRGATNPIDLPPESSFEAFWLGKVLVVIHCDGVVFFLPNSSADCPEKLCNVARQVAAISDKYTTFLNDNAERFDHWLSSLRPAVDGAKGKPLKLTTWSENMQQTKVQALAAMGSITTLGSGYNENVLSEALQRLWGLSEKRSQVLEIIDRLDELMRQSILAKSERRQRIYGSIFSSLGLGFALKETWEPIKEKLSSPYEWQIKMFHKAFHENPSYIQQSLQETADRISFYETLTIVFVVTGLLVGLLLYWLFGIRNEKE